MTKGGRAIAHPPSPIPSRFLVGWVYLVSWSAAPRGAGGLPPRTHVVAGVAVRELLEVVLVLRLRLPRSRPAGSTSVTTLPGQRPDASTSAIVSKRDPLLLVARERKIAER